jgi:hypothetical protein
MLDSLLGPPAFVSKQSTEFSLFMRILYRSRLFLALPVLRGLRLLTAAEGLKMKREMFL